MDASKPWPAKATLSIEAFLSHLAPRRSLFRTRMKPPGLFFRIFLRTRCPGGTFHAMERPPRHKSHAKERPTRIQMRKNALGGVRNAKEWARRQRAGFDTLPEVGGIRQARFSGLALRTCPRCWVILHGTRGVAQFGSAPALGAGGRWFESSRPDHAAVVQLVEPQPSKLVVAGSSPVCRSTSTLWGPLRQCAGPLFIGQ